MQQSVIELFLHNLFFGSAGPVVQQYACYLFKKKLLPVIKLLNQLILSFIFLAGIRIKTVVMKNGFALYVTHY